MTVKEEVKMFSDLTKEMANTFAKKRADYGQTTTETYDKFGPVSMLTRMHDKMGRLDNLLGKSADNLVGEKVEDTLLDLANYALITILELRKHETQAKKQGDEIVQEKEKSTTKWTPEYVRYIQMLAQDVVSLNTKISTETGEESELGDFIEDTQPSPDDLVAQQDRRRILIEFLQKYLSPREEKVLRMRFGFDDGRPRTLEEVGQHFGVTRERIRQVEAKAIRKLQFQFRKHKIKQEDL